MAYSFPLSVAQFMAQLPIQDITFDIPEALETSETGGGEILTADLGTRLWHGDITLGDLTELERDHAFTMLDVLRRAGASFMAFDPRRPGPRHDLNGSILGGAQPRLSSVAANNRECRLTGLPAGYQLRRYDYMAFAYGANPVRFALHRIASSATADGAGLTGLIEVSPNVRPGWSAAAPVTLHSAACKAIYVPGSFEPGRRRGTMTVGARFRFQQTLR